MKEKGIAPLFMLLFALIVLLAGYLEYQNGTIVQSSVEAQEDDASDPALEDIENVIWASGILEPRQWADLSSSRSGLVRQIFVAEGDRIAAGAPLIELESDSARADLRVAEAGLSEAQAALNALLAAATAADLAAARANLASAEANVRVAAGRMLETQAGIESAAAGVRAAQADYGAIAAPPSSEKETVAAADIEVAQAAVTQAQAAYNLVRGDPKIGARPESRALYEATAALEAAQARAALDLSGASAQQLAAAQAAIDGARAQLTISESLELGVEGQMQAARAQKDGAQAALDKLLAGATTEEVMMAEARVESALAAVAGAQARLAEYQVTAPFNGQVGLVSTRVGELAVPGETLVQFGDTNAMHVRTTDLRETDVVHLSRNMPVDVTFDALPDQIFGGFITRIAPVSNTDRGSTSYTVQIDVPNLDQRLRWGMTAFVNITLNP